MTQPSNDTLPAIPATRLQPAEALAIIDAVYPAGHTARTVLIQHGRQVANKAVKIALQLRSLNVDIEFIESAALLHDIGMIHTHAPSLGCHGPHPYLRHGILGRQILEDRGLAAHALVCERHVGAGISMAAIVRNGLDLPKRDMLPISLEEQIICYADKFFSKDPVNGSAKSVNEILDALALHGADQAKRFSDWVELFEGYPEDEQEDLSV